MDQADVPALLGRLTSDEEATRKMAVFKLQSSINDPSFADVFMSSGGLVVLRRLIMTAGGNTLAYALQSLTRLLEVDMGWEIFEGPGAGDLVERVVELIVTNPLVNILRGAMSILVALVGHSGPTERVAARSPGSFGFRALRPAVAVYPQFFEHVIHQLQSADHALCANALMLINALIRDAVSTDSSWPTTNNAKPTVPGEEWSKFIKRLQDLRLIKAVHDLMQSSALQDLAHPLLEFQNLTKILLRKWREVKVDLERPEHRRALKGLHLASNPDRRHANGAAEEPEDGRKKSARHDPEKWRRLGFETESPAMEFDTTGFLGMMDLTDYVRKNEDGFQKLLLEQSTRPLGERFPVARASLAVTVILCEMFEVDKTDLDDARGLYNQQLDGNAMADEKTFRPLLLQWSRLHTGGLQAFFRLWKATGAVRDDFDKVAELVRILVEQVVGQAPRTRDVAEVEEDLHEYDCGRLRELQMELLDLAFEAQWGTHLFRVREELKHEALQFVKEQRIRCLLQGSWFPKPASRPAQSNHGRQDGQTATNGEAASGRLAIRAWRFAKLSYNRRYLHYADFDKQLGHDPGLDALTEKVDLSTISSVVSNVSAPGDDAQSILSASTPQNAAAAPTSSSSAARSTTKITIFSFATASAKPASLAEGATNGGDKGPKETPLLTLHPSTHSLASEWLDGLLMLLNQAPITAETSKLVGLVSEYGLRIRLLNVRHDAAYQGPPPDAGVVPSREGLDEDYYYEV